MPRRDPLPLSQLDTNQGSSTSHLRRLIDVSSRSLTANRLQRLVRKDNFKDGLIYAYIAAKALIDQGMS
jgi:hypothetical protein